MSFGGGGFGAAGRGGGFGGAAAGGFGQQPAAGGFGAPAGGGFGQPAAGGFGAQPQAGGFGAQPQAGGGFGQPAAGGFGGQAAGGFGQQPAAGGFGAPQQQAGGFGAQQPAAGGFGGGGGFGGAATGGFGGGATTGGFGAQQPAAGGFGAAGRGAGGFGAAGAAGGKFTHHVAESTTSRGEKQTMHIKAMVATPANQGTVNQQYSTEMMFWDDFRAGNNVNDNTPPMSQLYNGGQAVGASTPAAGGGFGAPAAGGGFGSAGAGGAFGAGRGQTTTGFGGAAAGGGFGTAAGAGGFGAAGRGAGGFGATGATGFGGAAAPQSTFGKAPATGGFGGGATGFGGASAPAAGGFGKSPGGFGQPAAGGFGAPAAGGFGAQQPATGGFGGGGGFGASPPAAGGFGKTAGTGFGAASPPATGGFGAQPAAGGFGAQPAGGFGAQPAAGGFGAPAAGGFGTPAAGGGFGGGGGGFGGAATGGGFGAGQASAGGFGAGQASAGGFGAGRGTTTGFGAPAAGGFGAQPAAGGFGAPAAGGFGAPATGGFGAPASGGFGAPAGGGFGAASGGGFGAQAGSGFGGGGGFGGGAGGFGAAAGGFGAASTAGINTAQTLAQMPDFADKPYGNMLMYLRNANPAKPSETSAPAAQHDANTHSKGAVPRAAYQRPPPPPPTPSVSLKASTMTPAGKNDMNHHASMYTSKVTTAASLRASSSKGYSLLGAPPHQRDSAAPTPARALNLASPVNPTPEPPASNVAPVLQRLDEYVTQPTLDELQDMPYDQLVAVPSFAIFRRDGKSSVEFLEPVNLVRCVIDEAVVLTSCGRVEFYPGQDKPDYGKSLLVPCRVTVNGVVNVTSIPAVKEFVQGIGGSFHSYNRDEHRLVYYMNSNDHDVDFSQTSASGESVSSSSQSDHGDQPLDASPVVASSFLSRPQESYSSAVGWSDHMAAGPQQKHSLASYAPLHVPPKGSVVMDSPRSPLRKPGSPKSLPEQELIVEYPMLVPAAFDRQSSSTALAFHPKPLPPRPAAPPVYLLPQESSTAPQKPKNAAPETMLARSFRVGWTPSSGIALPSFARVSDALPAVAPAANGIDVHIISPTAQLPETMRPALSGLISVLAKHAKAITSSEGPSMITPVMAPQDTQPGTLLRQPLRQICECLKATWSKAQNAPQHRMWRLSFISAYEACRLFEVLYAVNDDEMQTPASDSLADQRRRRGLGEWLDEALALERQDDDAEPAEYRPKLLALLLKHKVQDAVDLCVSAGDMGLARIIGACGAGNTVGALARDKQMPDPSMSRVIRLLVGETEPFLTEPTYDRTGRRNADSTTWRQALGIYNFYACNPDIPVQDVVRQFTSRLSSLSSLRDAEGALPQYCSDQLSKSLGSDRSKDNIKRGKAFEDVCLTLLKSLPSRTCPPPTALHPNAASYHAHDFLAPFMVVFCVRGLGIERNEAFKEAESKALLGFAEQLEANGLWWCSALPLLLLDDATARADAIQNVVERHANDPQEPHFHRLGNELGVVLNGVAPRVAPKSVNPALVMNAPSLESAAAREKLVTAFCGASS